MALTTGVPITNFFATDATVTEVILDDVKAAVDAALTKTAKTYTWTTWTASTQGVSVSQAMLDDLKAGANVAADAYTTGCPSNNTVNVNNAVNSHNAT